MESLTPTGKPTIGPLSNDQKAKAAAISNAFNTNVPSPPSSTSTLKQLGLTPPTPEIVHEAALSAAGLGSWPEASKFIGESMQKVAEKALQEYSSKEELRFSQEKANKAMQHLFDSKIPPRTSPKNPR